MPIKTQQRNALLGVMAALVLAVVVLQVNIDPLRRQPAIEPPNAKKILNGVGRNSATLPFEYTLGAVSGFRQVIAGMLWVRADTFFHEGNYDAILPLIRMITWLDPNWLDVYATGGWHLMYNFTDTDQRSDRRYLPAGMALLNEGIHNNADVWDMYAEAGWTSYDKIKNYDEAIRYYEAGMKTKQPDITRVEHALAHSYERAGRIEQAEKVWEDVIRQHKLRMNDPNLPKDDMGKDAQSVKSAEQNLKVLRIRKQFRPKNIQPPVDAQFQAKVVRVSPKVLEISGSWNLVGAPGKSFSDKTGLTVVTPVEGARVDVRLQNAGYQAPTPQEFTFELPTDLTIMQDSLSTRGGRESLKGDILKRAKGNYATQDARAQDFGIFTYSDKEIAEDHVQGVPIDKAITSGMVISERGRKQIEGIAGMTLDKLRGDQATLTSLAAQGYQVSQVDFHKLGTYSRKIDMSKDPGMYNFRADKYDFILSVNPRYAPDFVKDRIGWNGEGMTDKRFLYVDKSLNPPVRMLRCKISISRDDILGAGQKVLFDSTGKTGPNTGTTP